MTHRTAPELWPTGRSADRHIRVIAAARPQEPILHPQPATRRHLLTPRSRHGSPRERSPWGTTHPDEYGVTEYAGLPINLVLFTLPTLFALLRCRYAAVDGSDRSTRDGEETG